MKGSAEIMRVLTGLLVLSFGLALLSEWRMIRTVPYWEVMLEQRTEAKDLPKVYFTGDGNFRERDAREGKVRETTAEWTIYSIPLPPVSINVLRLDPTASAEEVWVGRFELRSPAGGSIDLTELSPEPNEEVAEVEIREDGLRVKPIDEATDPFLVYPLEDPLTPPTLAMAWRVDRLLGLVVLWYLLLLVGWGIWMRRRAVLDFLRWAGEEENLPRVTMGVLGIGLVALFLGNMPVVLWLTVLGLSGIVQHFRLAGGGRLQLTFPLLLGGVAILFFGYAVLSSKWAGNMGFSHLTLAVSGRILAAFLIFGLLLRSRQAVDDLGKVFLILLLVSVGALAFEWLSGSYHRRATSFFPDPNLYAYFLVLTLPVAVGMYFGKNCSGAMRLFVAALFVLGGVGLVYSQSRGGVLALGAGLGFFCLVRFPRITLIGSVIAVVPAYFVLQMAFARLGRTTEASDSIRGQMIENLLSMIAAQPWTGVGVGNFVLEYPRHDDGFWATHTHNLFFQFQVELGIFGTLFLLFFVVTIAGRIISLIRRRPVDPELLGWASSLIGALVAMMFDYQVSYFALALLTLLPMWVIFRGHRDKEFSPVSETHGRRPEPPV